MREILFIVFEGMGIRTSGERGLLLTGHAGISFDGGHRIYGFHPTKESIDAYQQSYQQHRLQHSIFRFLRLKGGLRGAVQDDTGVFEKAYTLAQAGAPTEVWQLPLLVEETEYQTIHAKVLRQYQEAATMFAWYRFPETKHKPMPPGCNNCASWIRTVGLSLLEPTGRISEIMSIIRIHGTLWQP